jgi:hypothetical protein
MNRTHVAAMMLVIGLVAGCTLTTAAPVTSIPTRAAVTPTTADYTLEVVDSQQISDSPKYEIQIHKPVLSGPDASVVNGFNQTVDAMVDTRVSEFQTAISENSVPPAELGDVSSSFEITPEIYRPTPALISVRFTILQYIAGAAHPFTMLNTLTYDLTTGQFLTLADLFTPGAAYLETISNVALEQLREIFGDALFADGAAPTEDNYRNWNLTPDGLLISFQQYQVGPGAAGTMEARIAYAQLASMIRSDGALGTLVE